MPVDDDFSLGDVKLDSAQTTRKAWCHCNLGHRVVPVNVDYSRVEYTYNDDCQVCMVTWIYESDAESTKITFNNDCCGSLDGTLFVANTKDDELAYHVVFSVCCGTTIPCGTSDVHYVQVNIVACDNAKVIALATQLAFAADTCASCDFNLVLLDCNLTITNSTKGCAMDINDIGTCFTFDVLQQGISEIVEKLTFIYDCCGKLIEVITLSGKNIIGIFDPGEFSPGNKLEGSNGNFALVDVDGAQRMKLEPSQNELLEEMVLQLKIMNNHLASITGEDIGEFDLDLYTSSVRR